MWFIVVQFLVVHAFRCAVICFSFQLVQFGMIMISMKHCLLQKIRSFHCFDTGVGGTWGWPLQACFQTITRSEIAQLVCVREMTHTKAATCAVQVFPLSGHGNCVAVNRRATQAQF